MTQEQIPGVSKGAKPKNLRGTTIAALAEMIRRMALGDIKASVMAADLRALADVLDGKGEATDEAPANQEMLEIWKRIFAYWQKTANKPRARANSGRRGKVYARLRAGFSEAEIRKAIDGCISDEWHTENGKLEIEYICRSDTKLEEFIERAGGMPDRPERMIPDDREAEIGKLEARAMESLERGDDDTYEALQRQIARLYAGG